MRLTFMLISCIALSGCDSVVSFVCDGRIALAEQRIAHASKTAYEKGRSTGAREVIECVERQGGKANEAAQRCRPKGT